MSTSTGMRTSYDAGPGSSTEERQVAAMAAIKEGEAKAEAQTKPEAIPIPTVDEDGVEKDQEYYAEEARKVEITVLRGLRMARTATFQMADLSADAAIDLAESGETNPVRTLLGVGAGTGLGEGKYLFADLLERVADRIRKDGDFDGESLRLP